MIFLLQARPVKADLSTWWYVSLTALTALEVTTKVESNYVEQNLGIYSSSKLKQYHEKTVQKIPMTKYTQVSSLNLPKRDLFFKLHHIFFILGKISDNLKQMIFVFPSFFFSH